MPKKALAVDVPTDLEIAALKYCEQSGRRDTEDVLAAAAALGLRQGFESYLAEQSQPRRRTARRRLAAAG